MTSHIARFASRTVKRSPVVSNREIDPWFQSFSMRNRPRAGRSAPASYMHRTPVDHYVTTNAVAKTGEQTVALTRRDIVYGAKNMYPK